MKTYLSPTQAINFKHPALEEFVREHTAESDNPTDQAVSLYYAVRDGIRYDPYSLDLTIEGLRASTTLLNGYGWCVAKAILLTACCRSLKIPARLGFADVRNHLSTQRMRDLMKTDVFYWHGYSCIYLNHQWVKATPAFNIELCNKFNLKVLDFDGTADSIYHPFDLNGNRHMEYVKDRGEFDDVPIDEIIETFKREYAPDDSLKNHDLLKNSNFEKDVEKEIGG